MYTEGEIFQFLSFKPVGGLKVNSDHSLNGFDKLVFVKKTRLFFDEKREKLTFEIRVVLSLVFPAIATYMLGDRFS
jgi:hypothetical protein